MIKMKKLSSFSLLGLRMTVFIGGLLLGVLTVYATTVDEVSQSVGPFAIYTNSRLGYMLKYPESWKTYEIPSMAYMRVENIDARTLDSLSQEEKHQYFKIEVVVLLSEGLSLQKWVDRQNTTSYPLPKILEQELIEFAGYPALYQLEQFGSMVHPVIFVLKDNYVYIINISPKYKEHKSTIDEFLKNFEFNL